ncbi:MAG: hypothetical protein HYW15_02645 [Candidatus Giovannonibacteria bacterium]|nr:MAG: hypothetical protein HYW15_02645 [Candidatus Giovannonibacteria bacterium]
MAYGERESWIIEQIEEIEERKLHPIRLGREIVVWGKDYWGRDAWIKFLPTDKKGWFWLYDPRMEPVRITADLLHHKFRRTRLEYHGAKLEVFEHIGVLRWLGLERIIIQSTAWPPYYGRPYELWRHIKIACHSDLGSEMEWITVGRPIKRETKIGYTEIQPKESPELDISITCHYHGIGTELLELNLPADARMLEIALEACALGWPNWTYHLSRLASKIWWPHHQNITWLRELGADETLRATVLHRLGDLLGALSVVNPIGLLAARVISFYSGHKADVDAVQESQKVLKPRR